MRAVEANHGLPSLEFSNPSFIGREEGKKEGKE
jgi:hypothetical protein